MAIAFIGDMNRRVVLAVSLLASASGCSTPYAYVPTTNAIATVGNHVAADYAVPPEAPKGDVRIASYGITSVTPHGDGAKARALHLRLVLANNGATTWTLDTRAQRLDLGGAALLAPAFASANAGAPPPVVTVPPNGKRVIDLFFLLPPGLDHSPKLPEFDALWRVDTGNRVVADRTPFERLIVTPVYDPAWDYGPNYYWGGPYWMDPGFAARAGYGAGVQITGWPEFAPGDGYVPPPGEP
jgi:hypothetical protein